LLIIQYFYFLGKTTSLKVLAKEFNVQILEYKAHNQYMERDLFDDNLMEMNKNSVLSMNQFESFRKFVWDSNHYSRSLDFESSDGAMSALNSSRSSDRSLRLILIEEFPNLFYYKPESLHKELRLLERRFGRRCVPIVFIISETTNGQSDEYKLLPKTVQFELRITTISFKPITDTSLHKLLAKLCDYQLSKTEIQKVIDCSSGDVRSAINNMQLKYMHLFDNKSKSANKNTVKSQKAKKMKSSIESDLDSGGRDTSLSLSHAIGKVLYAKRIDSETDNMSEKSFKMPEHLSCNERIPLIENAEKIAEKVAVSSDVFNSWLHENYLDFVDNISNAEQCIHWLSQSDYMFSGQDLANKAICHSYQSSLAIRGLMFNLSTSHSRSSDSKLVPNQTCQKTNRQFRPFVKPLNLAVNRSLNSLKHQICQSMPQLTQFSGIDSLVIDFMPFVSQMPNRLRETDPQFLNLLNKVVNYDQNHSRINEIDLSDALPQSSFSQNFDQTKSPNSIRPLISELFSENTFI